MNIIKQTGTTNTTAYPGRKIEYLVVHYTAGISSKAGSARGCASWFANPAASGSADYIVDEEELIQYNPDPRNRYCHAVGGSRFNTQGGRLYGKAKNSNCVSLEICSTNSRGKITYPNDPAYSFTNRVLERAMEVVKQLMELYGIDAEHVIRHYDVNGKCCPGIIGWNKDSGDESRWDAFHAAIGGEPVRWYRVGTDWQDGKCVNQVEADRELENAKKTADQYGYKVFDSEGKVVYAADPNKATRSAQAKSIHALANETVKAAVMLELVHNTDKSGILPSVTTAQMILESGYCGTDLALNANNCFGMKESLSGNTWPNSTWNGKDVYLKKTQEDDGRGNLYTIVANFRKYRCVEDSILDHSAYLLGAKNGSKLRYEGLTNCTDYRQAIQLIKNGGYATDTKYVEKICSIIERYDLAKYDPVSGAEPVKHYRVRKDWNDADSQIGAFEILENAKKCADVNPGYSVFDDDGVKVYASKAEAAGETLPQVPFLVRITTSKLPIRTGPGKDYTKTGKTTGIGIFTIVELKNNWGRLKSGAGWINLDKVQRI